MQQNSFISRLEGVVFKYRLFVVAIFMGLTLFLGWSATRLQIDAGFSKMLPLKHEYMQAFTEYQDTFGGGNRIMLALMTDDGDIFTPEFMEQLRLVTEDMFYLSGVRRSRLQSLWTPNVRYREVTEDGVAGGNIIPSDYTPTPKGVAKVRSNVLKSEYVGRLVANDFSAALVSAELMDVNPVTGERLDYQVVAAELEAIRAKYEKNGIHVCIIGFAKMVGDMADGVSRVVLFFGVAFLITALMVYMYCRSIRRTGFLLVCALTAVVWELGLLPLLGLGIDPMAILVPFLVFAIAVSHGVQMISVNGAELFDGAEPLQAARNSFRRLFVPSITALATDVMGFVTILFINIQIIQEMAFTAGLGVAIIIITNMILLPIMLSYVGVTETYREKLHRKAKRMEPVWRTLSGVADRRVAVGIIMVSLVLLAVGLYKGGDIIVGDTQRGVPELRPDSRYNMDSIAITDKFSIGVDVLTIFAEAPSEQCAEYDVLSPIDEFEWYMQNEPGVCSSVSLPGVVKLITKAWNEGNPKWQSLPPNAQLAAQALTYIPTSTGLLNRDCSVMPINFYISDHKAGTVSRIMEKAKILQESNLSEKVSFRLAGGNIGVTAATNEVVVASQMPILFYVFGAVMLFCLIAFRSVRATICILLPLGLVSLLGYALMSVLGIGLKVNTLPIVALGVGVGVDYGIYIYGSMKSAREEGLPLRQAYEQTLRITGNGVLLTGFSLAAGVATWIFSPLQFQADMGILLTFLFLVNMLGAVVLLPALTSWLFRDQTS